MCFNAISSFLYANRLSLARFQFCLLFFDKLDSRIFKTFGIDFLPRYTSLLFLYGLIYGDYHTSMSLRF